VGCAKAILENSQVPLSHYLVITDVGIEKNKNFNLERSEIDHVKNAVKKIVAGKEAPTATKATSGGACSCSSC
jgi:uncharacterized metal-binding protein